MFNSSYLFLRGTANDAGLKWCYIAKRNLDAAISLYQKTYPGGKSDTFAITWTPYYLNYNPNPVSVDKLELADTRLADQTAEQRAALTTLMNRAGRAAGITFKWGGKIGPNPGTRDAHRLIYLSGVSDGNKSGGEVQSALVEALFEAYHTQSEDISDKGVLREAALRAGVNKTDLDAWLQSDKAGDIVDREAKKSKDMVVSGVPTIIIQREHIPDGIPDPMDLMMIFIQAREAQI